jgi:DNA recombination protein RmuC
VSIDLNVLLGLIAGLLAGCFLGWFPFRHKNQQIKTLQTSKDELAISYQELETLFAERQADIDLLAGELTELKVNNATLNERVEQAAKALTGIERLLSEKEAALEEVNQLCSGYKTNIAELETTIEKDREAAQEKLALLNDAKEKLAIEFKLLANQIFEEKGKAFSEQNCSSIDEMLKPMREQMGDFRKRVDEVHLNDSKDRASLKEHLSHLEKLNRQMSEDALNLTQALKGESKSQGNWGEMILERLLEASGLREGHEFAREQSFTDEDGKRLRPDVVIYMPGDKQVIIDSKVSLTDYERAVSATDENERDTALRAHVRSLKQHIQELSGKRYEHLPNVHSPDYVLMFLPIEGAYLMAIEADQSIFETAFEQRVAVVTPSTLYATLKLIEQLWRHEKQSDNVIKLIDRASKLHDKMVDFVSAFEEIGKRLNQAQEAYGTAHNRIKSGHGNVISQISILGKLAGKTKKELPNPLTEAAALQDQPDENSSNKS